MKTLAGLDYDERGAGEVVCLVHAGAFSAWFALCSRWLMPLAR